MILGIDARLANDTRRAGVGNYCAGLLGALPAAAPELTLRLYLDAPPTPGFSGKRGQVRVLPAMRGWTQFALARELRRDPPDVFFSPAMQLPHGCPCPAIVMVHDLAFLEFPGHFTLARRLRAKAQLAHVKRAAAHFLCNSQATADQLTRHCGIPAGRITPAGAGPGPGFDPPPTDADAVLVREKLELPLRFLLYVGRLQPRKNLVRLIEAFATCRAAHPELEEVHLLLAGDSGWLDNDIRRAAETSPARSCIRLLGFVDETDLPGLMRGAEALALVALWEGFGIPVIEAMRCGVPVLAANTGALPEVTGDAALHVDPYDTSAVATALARILTDAELRTRLIATGPVHAAQYTWEHAATCLSRAVRAVTR